MTIFGLTLDQWLHFKLYLGLAAPLLLFLYLPLVLFGLLELVTRKWRWRVKAPVLLAYLLLAYAVPLGDVTQHSMAMAKVCGKAGLHVYRTVKVEGFSSTELNPDWLRRYRYQYIESHPTTGGEVYHYEVRRGEIVSTILPVPRAIWQHVMEVETQDYTLGVTVTHLYIVNRLSREVIAEQFGFNPWLGWVDRYIGGVIDNRPGGCWGGRSQSLLYAVPKILISMDAE